MSTDEENFWLILPGRGAPVRQADKKTWRAEIFWSILVQINT
jgi:hypothetical protein